MSRRGNRQPDKPASEGYRLVPCTGVAHKDEDKYDGCALCSPRWGLIERLSPDMIHDIAKGYKRGRGAVALELARALDHVLSALWPAGPDPARDLEVIRLMLAAYAPNVDIKEE